MINFCKLTLFFVLIILPVSCFAQESKTVIETRKIVVEAINKVEKLLIGDSVKPEPKPEPQCLCNGTGFITHGDGHRTPCICPPGQCRCKKGDQTPIVQKSPNFVMYTKSWCGPCQKWKRENSKKVKDAGWDYTEIEDDSVINTAGVTSFPTFDITINGKVYRHKGPLSMEKFHEIVNNANREVRK